MVEGGDKLCSGIWLSSLVPGFSFGVKVVRGKESCALVSIEHNRRCTSGHSYVYFCY